jgi:hypothetical protein
MTTTQDNSPRNAVSTDDVAAFLRRADLNPGHWDVPEITRKANGWVTSNLIELEAMEPNWTAEDRAAHHAEFGALSAVDFVEQCVIEAGPDSAPCEQLQARVDAGDFDDWQPIWRHTPDTSPALPAPAAAPHAARSPVDDRAARLQRAQQRVKTLQRGRRAQTSVDGIEI